MEKISTEGSGLDELAEIEERSRIRQEKTEMETKELHELIGNFDYGYLEQEFKGMYKRSGIEDHQVHLVSLNKVFSLIDKDAPAAAYYLDQEREWLGINLGWLKDNFETNEKRLAQATHLFIHEQTHAASVEGEQVGFKTSLGSHKLWNEGVTEKLATEITRKYLDSHGDSTKKFESGYYIPVAFVDVVIRHIAEQAGVSEDTVWDAVKKAFFAEHIMPVDLEVEGILPSDFWEKMATAKMEDLEWWGEEFPQMTPREVRELPIEKKVTKVFGIDLIRKTAKSLREKLGL